jgi:hypothetical protein
VFIGGHVNCWDIVINWFLTRKLVAAPAAGSGSGGVRIYKNRGMEAERPAPHSLPNTLTHSLTIFYTIRTLLAKSSIQMVRGLNRRKLFISIHPVCYGHWNVQSWMVTRDLKLQSQLYQCEASRCSSAWYTPVVPKVSCTAPWGALDVGPSERVVRLFTIDQARAQSETPSSLRL